MAFGFKSNTYIIHINTYISCDSNICVYKLSEPLGKYMHIGISKEIVDTMSWPYAHTSYLNLWGIPIYAYSQTCHRGKNNGYNITTLHPYSYSEPFGNRSIQALALLSHMENI
jgi:hypothetical protein